jgi:hypothetical protein
VSGSSAPSLVEPAFRHAPQFTETLGPEVADIADLAGFAPDPEQQLALDLIFALDSEGKSAAFETALVVARQNLKTGTFKQAALGWLFVTDQRLVVWSAHEFSTTREAYRDMVALIENNRFLKRRLARAVGGNNEMAIELTTGQRLLFKARTKTGGRGLTGDKVVLDEAFALRPEHLGSLMFALSARPDPQLVYGSSACLYDSDVLRAIVKRGRAKTSPNLAYLEWCAPRGGCEAEDCDHEVGVEGCALDDPENLKAANPLLGRVRPNGTGMTLEYLRKEREASPPSEYARERLGWHDESGADEAFGAGNWEACVGTRPEGLKLGSVAVAVSYDLAWATIGAAGAVGETVYGKPLQHGPGTGWVVARARELQQQHGVDVVIDGRGPAADLIDPLKDAGVRLKVADTSDVLDAYATIQKAVRGRTFVHEQFPELDRAAASAVPRTVGDRLAWGRKQSDADISPLEAVTLAVWACGPGQGRSVYEERAVTTV